MSFLKKPDEEIIKIANPIWANLVKSSNIKDYGGFTKDFSSQMLYGANEVELGKQWASNELISNLSEDYKAFGCLRRGLYITVLYKQTSTKIPGEILGRLDLGEEDGNINYLVNIGSPESPSFIIDSENLGFTKSTSRNGGWSNGAASRGPGQFTIFKDVNIGGTR